MRLKENSFLYTLVYIIILLLAIAWACSFVSCNPVKKVLSDPKKLEKVGREWEKQNPCLPSEVKPGKDSIRIDTLFNNDFVFGSDSVYTSNDTVTIVRKVPVKVPVYITKTTFRVDTVPDLRRINLLERDKAFKDGQFLQEVAAKKEERERANTYLWILIGGFALYIGTRFIKVKPRWL